MEGRPVNELLMTINFPAAMDIPESLSRPGHLYDSKNTQATANMPAYEEVLSAMHVPVTRIPQIAEENRDKDKYKTSEEDEHVISVHQSYSATPDRDHNYA